MLRYLADGPGTSNIYIGQSCNYICSLSFMRKSTYSFLYCKKILQSMLGYILLPSDTWCSRFARIGIRMTFNLVATRHADHMPWNEQFACRDLACVKYHFISKVCYKTIVNTSYKYVAVGLDSSTMIIL